MTFEFTVHPHFNFVDSFAAAFNIPVHNNGLRLPDSLGNGSIKKIDLSPGFKLVMHHYTLSKDFTLTRLAPPSPNSSISIVFNSNEIPTQLPDTNTVEPIPPVCKCPAVQIASASLGTSTVFKAGVEVFFAVIGITPTLLGSLLNTAKTNSVLETVLASQAPFFYHEKMSADMQKVLRQLSVINSDEGLAQLQYSIKVQELMYLLFSQLLHRETQPQSPLNKADVDRLYAIRDAIIADLSQPPSLPALALQAGISETKMKQLFKQIFGDSIYNFYQRERMEEAGRLLRQGGYSVSEAGYQLGFSNLSHFSRLFTRYHGKLPKKYTAFAV